MCYGGKAGKPRVTRGATIPKGFFSGVKVGQRNAGSIRRK